MRRMNAVTFRAKVDCSKLTPRIRNKILRGLQRGVCTTWQYSGSGALLRHFFKSAGVFWVTAKSQGFYAVNWDDTQVSAPKGFLEGVEQLVKADRSACAVQGKTSTIWYRGDTKHLHLDVLRPSDHIPPLIAEYVESEGYKQAVQPYIDLVEQGKTIHIDIT